MVSFIQKLSAVLFVSFLFGAIAEAQDNIQLPAPQQDNGMSIFEAFKKRSSTPGGAFGVATLSDQELSTVLWAASGLNRGEKGWTIPTASGQAPYVRIFVAGKNGVFLYQWQNHYLQPISQQDIRGDIALQSFARRAAYSLIFVAEGKALSTIKDQEKANNFSQIAVGAMSQNIYLAAAALQLNVRYISGIKSDTISEELNLTADDKPIGIMLLGK